MTFMFRVLVLIVTAFFGGPCNAQDDTLVLGFNDKPPLFYWENELPKGVIVDLAIPILKQAGVRYRFESMPFPRSIQYLREGKPNFAALGFNKTAEREQFVNFSKPIFRDSTAVVLVRADEVSRFRAYSSFDALIDSGKFTFGGKQGNSYPIDAQLKRLGDKDVRFSFVEPPNLTQLLVRKRFDFMVLFPEELEPALTISKVSRDQVEVISYPDMPPGQDRYFLFSKGVAPDVVARINEAITKLVKPSALK
jgi:polar amino acid transport system substrate-binding protein